MAASSLAKPSKLSAVLIAPPGENCSLVLNLPAKEEVSGRMNFLGLLLNAF